MEGPFWYVTNGRVGTGNSRIVRGVKTERGLRRRLSDFEGPWWAYRLHSTSALFALPDDAEPDVISTQEAHSAR